SDGLHRRRHTERKTRRRLWPDRRRIWTWFYPGTGHWRSAGGHQHPAAVLGRCGIQPRELALWLPVCAGIAATPERIHAAPRQPPCRAGALALPTGGVAACDFAVRR